ncbi:hypothetical protein KPL74_10805 [Bacillus sp. NP157]|nr:hypothetical protein KPL74_10805 [Bacillus sp. NP157]
MDRETEVLLEARKAGITQPRELANYMAQVTHESNGLSRLEESFRFLRNISQVPVQAAWRNGPDALDAARKEALAGRPEGLAELMYAGRHGNHEPGDGWQYRGRGYIRLVGRDNYRAAGDALGLDLENQPDLAAEPRHAARIAAWLWREHVPEQARGNVEESTRAINGKLHGLDDRQQRFNDWQRRLSPEVMQRIEGGNLNAPVPSHDRATTVAATAATVAAGAAATAAAREASGPTITRKVSRLPRAKEELTEHGLTRDAMAAVEHAEDLREERSYRRHHCHHMADAAHPQHKLFESTRDAVRQLDARHHRQPDQQTENIAGALSVEARKHGLDHIDHVTLSDDASRVYAVQGDLDSPLKKVVELDTARAAATPLEQSDKAMATLDKADDAKAAQPEPPKHDHDQAQQAAAPVQGHGHPR